MGNNLKVVWAEFLTLSLAVLVMSAIGWHTKASSYLELKALPLFCPVNLHLSLLMSMPYLRGKDPRTFECCA
jgi:hypothetical protein